MNKPVYLAYFVSLRVIVRLRDKQRLAYGF